ncbi:MAG: hypothetical protein ACR2K3_04795 [Nocardioides sp.]
MKVCTYRSGSLLTFELADGFVLRYEPVPDATGRPLGAGVRFVGIQLSSRAEVDGWFDRLQESVQVVDDMRERHRSAMGPYGFVVADPDGYRFKLFRYNTGPPA